MSKKILVVDDEADIVRLLKYNLEKEGYDVITAQDGKAAIEKARTHPDLIVLDVMMPELDGWEVIRELKKKKETADIPVLFQRQKNRRSTKFLVSNWARTIILLNRSARASLLHALKRHCGGPTHRQRRLISRIFYTCRISLSIFRIIPSRSISRMSFFRKRNLKCSHCLRGGGAVQIQIGPQEMQNRRLSSLPHVSPRSVDGQPRMLILSLPNTILCGIPHQT